MSGRLRDRERRRDRDDEDQGDQKRRSRGHRDQYNRRSPDYHYSSSDEFEDFNRVVANRSILTEQRHHRSDSRHDRSRSPADRCHRSHPSHSDKWTSRHQRHQQSGGRTSRETPEELEEGQYLPEELEEDEDHCNDYERRDEVPNNTIMMRGLGPDIYENDILAELARHALCPKDIRLMRHKDTGESRGFAFVEFASLEESVRWKRLTKGRLELNGSWVTLHFSVSKESHGDASMQKNDWTCYKCGVNNFKRREVCFKCETHREESEANDTGDEISPVPTNCLLLRNLSAKCTSDQILSLVSSLTNAPIKSIRFPKDPVYNMPRCVCYLELHTTSEAIQLSSLIASMDTSFLVESAPLIINYAKRNSAAAMTAYVATNAASAALAAAHWTNQTGGHASSSDTASALSSQAIVSVNGVSYQKFPKPDPSLFQLEDTSGFYYDSSTRLYYDPKSTYYFNSMTQQYLRWSDEHETYLPAVAAAESAASTYSSVKAATDATPVTTSVPADSKESEKQKTPDKVKTAKKIARDMEKWVKSLNQKSNFRTSDQLESPTVDSQRLESSSIVTDEELSESPATVDPLAVRREEEAKAIDWSKLLCLLCKRQFASREQLTKHLQLSELHTTNLNNVLRSVLTVDQMMIITQKGNQYVDRALGRRKKWGPDVAVQPNLLKEKYLEEIAAEETAHTSMMATLRVDRSSKGSKMLQAMGWKEGEGLGRRKEGRTEIIDVEARPENPGLGQQTTSIRIGETYKDTVKRAMAQRYKQLFHK